jgi:apolipoprotein N-acyltransferase
VYDQQRRNGLFDALFTGKATNAQRETARVAYAHLTDDLFVRTEQEAQAGAKIVLWPEAGTSLLQEDEAALLARASTLSAKDGIYLEIGLIIVTGQSPFAQNKAILLDPIGNVVWSYDKAHPVPGEPWLPGDGKVPTAVTPYGRLATVICFDADFYFTSDAQVMVAYVPTNGVRTIYAAIGDLFAWLCIAGLVIFIGMAVVQRRAKAVDERQALPRPERVLEEKVP